ncbi:MAG TPA: hypothetical protein VME22_04815 [Solirubrobacteraceae bacterium]|nr:hypothetical protein [Solirubrobacteraceae bacterium]
MAPRSRIAAVGSLLLLSLTASGCGAASSSASAPAKAAKRFIAAIDRGDTRSWCPQIGGGFLEMRRQGPLPRPVLEQCEQDDLFLIMGYCQREAVVANSSVTRATQSGDRAEVSLSSGARLQMTLEQHAWLIERIIGGHASGPPPAGRCSNVTVSPV